MSEKHVDFNMFDFLAEEAMKAGYGPQEDNSHKLTAVIPTNEPVGLKFAKRYMVDNNDSTSI